MHKISPLSRADLSKEQSDRSETTRYLAAAAHYDPAFRRAVLDSICNAEFRCKAPEFGINEHTIIEQCHIAERRRKIREALLFGTLLAFLLLSGFLPGLFYVLDHPDQFGLLLQDFAPELILMVFVATAIAFGDELIKEHFTLRKRFTKQALQSWPSADRHPTTQRQNLVIYGGYSPFVGSGLSLRDWSFSVNLQKTNLDSGHCSEDEQLSVESLTEAIQRRLSDLAIPNLEQYYVLFADGRYVREDRRLMPSPYNLPPRHIPEKLVIEESSEQETCRRSYLCIAVTDWNGEVVLTTYLRFKNGASHLFAEASHFILPPLKQNYYSLDSMDPSLKIKRVVQLVLTSLIAAPFILLKSPFAIYAIAREPLHRLSVKRQIRKAIRDNPMFNYGAFTSIRQLGMENRFRVFFQQLDRDMHLKTIEQCLIDAIVDYLDEHGIDTSDIRERRATILNTGVLISGGVVTAQSVAVGSGARSVISKIKSISSAE